MPPISMQKRWLTSGTPPTWSGSGATPRKPAAGAAPAVPPYEVANIGVRVNGRDRSAPWQCLNPATATEVWQAVQLVNGHSGFDARLLRVPALVAWIWLPTRTRLATIRRRMAALGSDLLQDGLEAVGDAWLPVGCIPGIDVRETEDGAIAARLYSEKIDAAGQEVIAKVARAMATPLARLAECEEPARVELQLLQFDRVRVRCRIDARAFSTHALAPTPADGSARRERLPRGHAPRSLGLDSHDPAVAAAHNARLLEALMRAGFALGIDASPWASEARCYAARWGNCEPLANWRATRNEVIGELRLPVHLAPGDAVEKRHRIAEVVTQAACIGLASSLACLCVEHSNELGRPARRSLPPPLPSRDAREPRGPKARSESGIHPVQYIVGRSLAR